MRNMGSWSEVLTEYTNGRIFFERSSSIGVKDGEKIPNWKVFTKETDNEEGALDEIRL